MKYYKINEDAQAIMLLGIVLFILSSEWTWAFLCAIELYTIPIFIILYLKEIKSKLNQKKHMRYGWNVIGNEVK